MTRGNRMIRKRRNRRDINSDNLTDIERQLLILLATPGRPMSVKEMAESLLGPDVDAEARGKDSVRTVRNALRVPKAMGLLKHAAAKGHYEVTETFEKYGFEAAVRTAAAWKVGRAARRAQLRLENRDGT